MEKVIIRGFKRELDNEETDVVKQSRLDLKASYKFSSTRDAGQVHIVDLDKNDMLEFVFDDNTTWTGSQEILHDIFPEMAAQKRSAGDGMEIPMYLREGDAERGLVGNIAVKVLNVFTKKAVTSGVKEIAADLEKKLLNNTSGVYKVNPDFTLTKEQVKSSTQPYLLFIHGTNSHTAGSFSEIKDSELWRHMQSVYKDKILGLQHETLTKSPIQNVIDLLNELPDQCTLHIITHSRGGLVGDVLARYCDGGTGFNKDEMDYLEKTERSIDIALINKLQKIASGKKINLAKFIRVACPAYGTTILSKRLDHFLNISMNLIGLLGPVTSVVAAGFKNLLAAAVNVKNDPGELPGLEAMNPDSPFLKVLNNPLNSIESPLTIISGNCGIKFNLKALLIIASRLFYMRDNDLVVDTKSMYCGSKRKTGTQYYFDEGPEVDHVHYFKNAKTQSALLMALKSTAAVIPGFTPYEQTVLQTLDRNALLGLDGGGVYTDMVSGNKPIVILLPGIMGSNLEHNEKKIWINYMRFLVGELTRLDISKTNISATSLIKTSYKKLVDYLGAEYDVVTFPFDWRKPLTEAAALLNQRVEQYLRLKVPVKIIGHSMGGVVTRDFIINHPATWKKLNASKDFKLLLLGAPLGGSYRIPYVLTGKDPIISQLSKIDLKHTKKELLDMFRKYPGLLGLLPVEKDPVDFADEKVWKKMKEASLFDWTIPDKKDLQAWGSYRDKVLKNRDAIELENIIYIAGKDDATVCGFEINDALPDEKLVFKSTAEGDQSVTWDSGIPAKLNNSNRLYFVDVSHGALANNADIFNGIGEILKMGQTTLLKRDRPAVRGTAKVFDTVAEETYDVDERSLENSILGISERPSLKKTGGIPLQVTISNGDLYYSRYPILVGHFLTDGITGAEWVIDNYTGNLLKGRHRLNLYPGEIGTNEVFVNPDNAFNGTIVVGLGAPGKLSAMQLAKTVENGAITYMYELRKTVKKDQAQDDIGISALLIGSNYGNLSIGDSMRAVIQGIQNANSKIEVLGQEGVRTIRHIEFVELYEDRCIQCLYLLRMLEAEPNSSISFWLREKRINKLRGSRTRIPIDMEKGFWNRISIAETALNNNTELSRRALRFSLNNSSAREEQRDLYTSPEIINDLIEEMSTNNNWNEGLARSVFELLIPNEFKDEIKKQYKTMWVLDNASAAYPWELLHDFSNSPLPFCCSTGMIRQLQTDKYRLKINAASGNKALVIGDPDLNGFPYARQLNGAKEEAEHVIGLLQKHRYEMRNNCINKSSREIIQALFKDEYRIIHLAGHGIFNEKNPDLSGMLIGNAVFLTAKEIYQMSKVPDFVFVNCCFLGKISGPAEELSSNRYKLAANIGTQLIMNGVKAVIAAGWAVHDDAAKCFTEEFYRNFLDSKNFGDSIQAARTLTFNNFPNNNTWGAYQCYGDPYFNLPRMEEQSDRGSLKTPEKIVYEYKPDYLLPLEAEIDLNNLLNQVDSIGFGTEWVQKRIASISEAIDKAEIRTAAMTEKEATLYAECNNYEMAVKVFEDLFTSEHAAFTVGALEKYCNIRAKLCVRNWQSGIEKNGQAAVMEKVIKDLKQLIAMNPTAERYTLMGSACKRQAMITTSTVKKITLLAEAAQFYKRAYEASVKNNKVYLLTAWLDIENILVLVKKHKWNTMTPKKYKLPALKTMKEQVATLLKTDPETGMDMSFWNKSKPADAYRCLWLLNGGNTKTITEGMIMAHYTSAWDVGGSQYKKMAQFEHLEFLKEVYTDMVKSPKTVKMINKLMSQLKKYLK